LNEGVGQNDWDGMGKTSCRQERKIRKIGSAQKRVCKFVRFFDNAIVLLRKSAIEKSRPLRESLPSAFVALIKCNCFHGDPPYPPYTKLSRIRVSL